MKTSTSTRRKILFLCTGNSCRSQMAEAIVNARFGSSCQAFSAGNHPTGFVDPRTIQVLKEIGIEHRGRSKSVEEYRDSSFDLVVTVCHTAAEECPVWLGAGRKTHFNFPDPAKAIGNEEEIIDEFRTVRDAIARELTNLLVGETLYCSL
jgi:arsenate reductase